MPIKKSVYDKKASNRFVGGRFRQHEVKPIEEIVGSLLDLNLEDRKAAIAVMDDMRHPHLDQVLQVFPSLTPA